MNAALTLEQIQDKFTELQKTADDLDKKLSAARSGAQQISAADVTKVESSFSKMMEAWAKRRRIFNNLWDAVSENMDGKQSALFEDIGIETDEAVGEVLSNYQKLLQQNKRLKK